MSKMVGTKEAVRPPRAKPDDKEKRSPLSRLRFNYSFVSISDDLVWKEGRKGSKRGEKGERKEGRTGQWGGGVAGRRKEGREEREKKRRMEWSEEGRRKGRRG